MPDRDTYQTCLFHWTRHARTRNASCEAGVSFPSGTRGEGVDKAMMSPTPLKNVMMHKITIIEVQINSLDMSE